MEIAYRERWQPVIDELQRILARLPLAEETKWGQPCYTADGKNVVIIGGLKAACILSFFQGALLADKQQLLEQLGTTQAARVMKLTSADDVRKKEKTIAAYVREAIALAKAGKKVETVAREYPIPDELTPAFRKDKQLKAAFDALTPGRQRSYLFHFAGAKQASTRVARIEKARPGIFAGRGFLERGSKA